MGSAQPPAVSLRVMLRADDLDAFVDRYSHFIDGDRIFIFTKTAKNVGDRVRFSLCLSNGEAVLNGEGTVTRVQKDGDPTRPPGMELRFQPTDESSQTLVEFLLATRADLAHGDDIEPPGEGSPNVPSMKVDLKTFLAGMTPPTPQTPPATPPQQASSTPVPAPELPPMRLRRPTPIFTDLHVVLPPPGTVPANPFSQVSDNAIEYFVEWSLESNVGPHKESTANFSNVMMALPDSRDDHTGEVARPRALPRWAWGAMGSVFVAGIAIGVTVGLSHKPPELPPRVVVVPAPAAEPPPPPPAEPPPPPPVAAPQLEPAMLSVRSRPPGAVVLVDGKRVGVTPLQVPSARGRHQLTLSHERYTQSVVSAEAPGSVDVPLQRPTATLVVSANVPSAAVVVSGGHRGAAPLRISVRAFERYNIEVSARGASPWRRTVYVRTPSTEIHANLGVARR
jgi:PEGA domain